MFFFFLSIFYLLVNNFFIVLPIFKVKELVRGKDRKSSLKIISSFLFSSIVVFDLRLKLIFDKLF